MKNTNLKLCFTTIGLALLGGCATVPRGAGFGDVQKEVADRTGHLAQWRGNTVEGRGGGCGRPVLAR